VDFHKIIVTQQWYREKSWSRRIYTGRSSVQHRILKRLQSKYKIAEWKNVEYLKTLGNTSPRSSINLERLVKRWIRFRSRDESLGSKLCIVDDDDDNYYYNTHTELHNSTQEIVPCDIECE
jgi:hypothetical protein